MNKCFFNHILSVTIFLLCGILFSSTSCKKEDKTPITPPADELKNGVWVINEGNFNGGNASLDFYRRNDGKVEKNVFESINGRPLGDVLQSIYLLDGKYYIVVNNSQKMEIADAGTFKNTGAVYGMMSPRYFLPLNSGKAYITDLYANAIWLYDVPAQKVSGKIDVQGWTEQMLIFDEKLFVTQVKRNKVLVIDTKTDKILDSIAVGEEPQWILKDKEDKIWVLCNAYKKNQPASLHRIDPQTNQVLNNFSFPNQTHSPTRLCMNGAKDSLFYLDKGVRGMSIYSQNLPTTPFIPEKQGSFYGLGYDARDAVLYVGDALDYVQPGFVFRFHANGTPLDSFRSGVNPADFYFIE